jgi:hypothetical protein
MTIRWQNVSIPFAAGVDTKSDSKSLTPEKLANLENGVFTKRGSIIKRNGTVALSRETDLLDKNGNARAIQIARAVNASANELLMADDANLLSYNSTREMWIDRGSFKSVVVTPRTVADLDSEQTVADCCTGAGHILYAWEDNRGGIYMHLVEESTGAVVVADRQVTASGAKPKCAFLGKSWHIIYSDTGNTLRTYRVNTADFTGTAFQLRTDLGSTSTPVDVAVVDDTYAVIAYEDNDGTPDIGVCRLQDDGTLDEAVTITYGVATAAIAIAYEPNTERYGLFVCQSGGAQILSGRILNKSLGVVHTQSNLHIVGATVNNIAAAFHRDAGLGENIAIALLQRASSEAMTATSAAGSVLDVRGNMTIECLVNFVSTPAVGFQTFVCKDDGSSGYVFWWNEAATDKLRLTTTDASGSQTTVTVDWTPTLATWYHLAVTKNTDTGEVKFYVDGVQQGSTQTIAAEVGPACSADFEIGRTSTPAFHLDGYIDEVRVWDRVRTIDEISANRLRQIPKQSGLVGYWKMNDAGGDDASGNGTNLTDVGTVSYPTSPLPFSTYTGVTPDDDDYFAEVFYEIDNADNWNKFVRRIRMSVNGEISTTEVFMRHAGIASRAFLDDNDVCVHLCHQDDGIQNTAFCVTDDRTIVTKLLSGTHGGLITNAHLPNVQSLPGREFRMASVFRKRLATTPRTIGSDGESSTDPPQENESYSGRGVKELTLAFADPQSHRLVQVGPTAYLNGGFIWQYDGYSPVESGFHLFPANVTAATANNAKEIPDSGAYFYRVYYEWTNARGERERSTFGSEVRADLAAGEDEVTLTIPTLSFTGKRGDRRDVSIVVYRTEKNPTADSPFYRVSSPDPTSTSDNAYLANDPTVDTVTFVDGYRNLASDTGTGPVLIEQELDYKNSAELDNFPPESVSIITEGKDRIFMAGFEDQSEVRYSKQHFAGSPVEFNDSLKFTVSEDGGPITALAIHNESLVIYKRDQIYTVTGAGPNNVGGGQSFSRPALITTNVGCVDQRSVVRMPQGLMFKSVKGIYLLTQQLQVAYIGADVEAYNSQDIVSAELNSSDDEVIFLTSSGRTLVYNYLFGQWSTFTNYTGTDGAVWNDAYVFGRPDGQVRRGSSTSWSDVGAAYALRIETAWIKLRGLQGFQRCRRASILGEWMSAHKLRMGVAYDYEDVRRNIILDPVASNIAITHFGDPSGDFGDGGPFGSGTVAPDMESTVYQFRAHLPRQKCQAVKFFFEDRPASSGVQSEQGYELTELMLEVGVKKGLFKPADAKTTG